MSTLNRFGVIRPISVSDHEAELRWRTFRRRIRSNSTQRSIRWFAPMLGENTRRYHVARRFQRLSQPRATKGSPLSFSDLNISFPIKFIQPLVSPPPSDSSAFYDEILTVVIPHDENDPGRAVENLNSTIEATSATWLLLLDEDVVAETRTTILNVLSRALSNHIDVVFADEEGLIPHRPVLKPDLVGAHSLLSYNVVGRPALIRLEALRRLGGFEPSAGWAFDHDFFLRLHEVGGVFHHVRSLVPGQTLLIPSRAARLEEDTLTVVRRAMERRHWSGTVSSGAVPGVVDWRINPPVPAPSVDIIIPTRDRIDLLERCIASIEDQSSYTNYNIIILDNDSVQQRSKDFFASSKYRVIPCPGDFNYARIINQGVEESSADFVLTLNNDTVVVTNDWLEQLVGLASLDDVALVGARLIDPSQHHDHDGVVIAPYPQHLRVGSNYPTNDGFATGVRDVAAVTGAVQIMSRALWRELGGMDETLRVIMNDIDLCLRSQETGRFVVFTPNVSLIHEARSSRGSLDPTDDRTRFIQRWDIFGSFHDPFAPAALELLGDVFHYR